MLVTADEIFVLWS